LLGLKAIILNLYKAGIRPVFKKISLIQILYTLLYTFPESSFAVFHADLTATTNNIERWFTKSANHFALKATIDYEHSSGLYLGSSASNIEYEFKGNEGQAANFEIIPYLGYSYSFSDDWRMDAQWSRYLYDGNVFGHPADYNEYYLFLHYQDFISSRISFADNYYNLGSYSIDYQLTGRYPLTDYLEFSTSFGYSQTKAVLGSDYTYWNVGGTYFYKFVSLDFRYIDATETSIDQAVEAIKHESYDPPLIGPTFLFSVSVGY